MLERQVRYQTVAVFFTMVEERSNPHEQVVHQAHLPLHRQKGEPWKITVHLELEIGGYSWLNSPLPTWAGCRFLRSIYIAGKLSKLEVSLQTSGRAHHETAAQEMFNCNSSASRVQ